MKKKKQPDPQLEFEVIFESAPDAKQRLERIRELLLIATSRARKSGEGEVNDE